MLALKGNGIAALCVLHWLLSSQRAKMSPLKLDGPTFCVGAAPPPNTAATEDPLPNWNVKASELPPLQQPKCGIDFLLLHYPPKNCPSPNQFPFFFWTQRRQRELQRFVRNLLFHLSYPVFDHCVCIQIAAGKMNRLKESKMFFRSL